MGQITLPQFISIFHYSLVLQQVRKRLPVFDKYLSNVLFIEFPTIPDCQVGGNSQTKSLSFLKDHLIKSVHRVFGPNYKRLLELLQFHFVNCFAQT